MLVNLSLTATIFLGKPVDLVFPRQIPGKEMRSALARLDLAISPSCSSNLKGKHILLKPSV